LDATVIPRPWSPATIEKYAVKRLKFGYYLDDGVTISSPPVKRAILETVNALQRQGHQCIQIVPPNVIEAARIFVATTSNNGYQELRNPIKHDPMEPSVKFILTLASIPGWLRSLLAFAVDHIIRDPITASTMRVVGWKSAGEMTEWTKRRDAYRQDLNDWFRTHALDALIAPTSTIPAAKINGTKMVGALSVSTFLYNVLDWPVGVVPVTTVRKGEAIKEGEWKGRAGYSSSLMNEVYGKKGCYADIVEGGEGLPVGVQVVGGKSVGEEGVLAIMERVVDALKDAGANI